MPHKSGKMDYESKPGHRKPKEKKAKGPKRK